MSLSAPWPEISEARDGPTIAALHLFSQILGKVATAALPWRNHGWHLTLHLSPRGLRTEPIHLPTGTVELALDLLDHRFLLEDSAGARREMPLRPMAVADFYRGVTGLLADAGHAVRIHAVPNEIDPAIPFERDTALRTYDRDSAERVHRALLGAHRVLSLFRSSFLGKVSPVHFFWGSFDLAVTRFSGRTAPLHPGGVPHLPDAVTREAYSHEVSSAGFWPGGANGGVPFFYSYAYPAPDGFAEAMVEPDPARFDTALGEFVLPYDAVRTSDDPDATLLAFLESSYAAAADIAHWDRAALECEPGRPGVPRRV
ncbi:DUF5996 family protein [Allosphingosinicella humi]